jgi:predicted CXXCH cytochrome family protein
MRYILWLILSSVIVIIGLNACSPKVSRNVLSFFFDGVPDQNKDSSASSTRKLELPGINDSNQVSAMRMKPEYFFHYPYKEKDCAACHDENSKSELISVEPDLCYACHENFAEKYKVVHGPVSGGYCTVCHNPHLSENKYLLTLKGIQLCLFCHDRKDVLANEMHKDIGENDCLACHNPHGGEDRFFIR